MTAKTHTPSPYRHVQVRLRPVPDRGQLKRVAELFEVLPGTGRKRAS